MTKIETGKSLLALEQRQKEQQTVISLLSSEIETCQSSLVSLEARCRLLEERLGLG